MISISKHSWYTVLFLCAIIFVPTDSARAQSEGVSITVAPTLVELSAVAGERWRSSVKVVNTNNFPLTIYAEPAHFEPVGESGQGSIVPATKVPETESVLARWIEVENSPITIAPGTSANVGFQVQLPDDVAPGSHFAALQISTAPPDLRTTGVNTAQVVSSLIFLRVAGAINESAGIRSFSASNSYQTTPHTELELRFENHGNVHVRPVGEITISNMWGMERGSIPVNVNTSFGNALPDTIRAYDFQWRGEPSLFDVGRYTAKVALAYGVQERQFATSTASFWVIPVKAILITLSVIALIIGLIIGVSRWYITRLLALAGVPSLDALQTSRSSRRSTATSSDTDLVVPNAHTSTMRTWWQHWLDIWATSVTAVRYIWQSLQTRARRIAVILLGLLVLGAVVWFVSELRTPRSYEATIGNAEQAVTYNAEEIAFFQQPGRTPADLQSRNTHQVHVINESRSVGAAGRLAATLVPDIPVTTLGMTSDLRKTTVIVFPLALQAEAEDLAARMPGALLSASTETTQTITIYVGETPTW